MIYLWEIPEYYPEKLIGEYDRTCSPDRFMLAEGEPIDKCDLATIRFIEASLPKLMRYDVLPNSSMLPLVNLKVRKILKEKAPEECQFLNAKIIASDGETDDYNIVVSTKKQDILNKDDSKYSLVSGTDAIMGFTTLRYYSDLFKYNLAREANYLSHLLVSQSLRDALENANISGLYLPTPEELYP